MDHSERRIAGGRFEDFLRLYRLKVSRCFGPYDGCTNRAVRAHSIPRPSLALLARRGHVVTVVQSASAQGALQHSFRLVGCSKVTTFTGLCGKHDNEIFAPIEKSPMSIDKPEHLFLVAYRPALYELHSQIEAALKVQGGYLYRVERGLDPAGQPSPAGLSATDRLCEAAEIFFYKTELDAAYLSKDFSVLCHSVLTLDLPPTVGACSLFCRVFEDHEVTVHLSVLPVSTTRTVAVFSFPKADGRLGRRLFGPILQSHGTRQQHELSRLILRNCGNFALSPDFFDSWSPEKRQSTLDYFVRTITQDDPDYDSPLLDLFSAHT